MDKNINILKIANNIINHHKFLGRDKLDHFYTASIGFFLFSLVFGPGIASIIVSVVALSKELIHDKWLGRGKPEILDLLMSILPIMIYWCIQL